MTNLRRLCTGLVITLFGIFAMPVSALAAANPPTGDNSNLLLYGGLSAAAFIAAIAFTIISRRKKPKDTDAEE